MARVVACVPDLMDRSKVDAAARAAGVALQLVGQPSGLESALCDGADRGVGNMVDMVIVDLSRPGALDAVRELGGSIRTVGFGSHVDRELLSAGREAGCETVMARSAFFSRLSDLFGQLAPDPDDQPGAAISSSEVIGPENVGGS
ncbi:MAG: hypothetical protein ACRDX8_01745 [Acidimicrobiales bacterium]